MYKKIKWCVLPYNSSPFTLDKVVKSRVSHKATKSPRVKILYFNRPFFVSSVPPCEKLIFYEFINFDFCILHSAFCIHLTSCRSLSPNGLIGDAFVAKNCLYYFPIQKSLKILSRISSVYVARV